MIFLSKCSSSYALGRLKWILDIIWPLNQSFNLKNQRNWMKQVLVLNFLIGIICILLHWWKKLTLIDILPWCSFWNSDKDIRFQEEGKTRHKFRVWTFIEFFRIPHLFWCLKKKIQLTNYLHKHFFLYVDCRYAIKKNQNNILSRVRQFVYSSIYNCSNILQRVTLAPSNFSIEVTRMP
jgi:hypothetical protein